VRSGNRISFTFTNTPRQITATFSLPIFDGFQRERTVGAGRKVDQDDARYNQRAGRVAVTADVTSAYLTLTTLVRTVQIQEQNSAAARDALLSGRGTVQGGPPRHSSMSGCAGSLQRAETIDGACTTITKRSPALETRWDAPSAKPWRHAAGLVLPTAAFHAGYRILYDSTRKWSLPGHHPRRRHRGRRDRGHACPEAPEVRIEPVTRRDLVASVTASGQVEPHTKVDMSAELGRHHPLAVKEGQREQGPAPRADDPRHIEAAVERSEAALSPRKAHTAGRPKPRRAGRPAVPAVRADEGRRMPNWSRREQLEELGRRSTSTRAPASAGPQYQRWRNRYAAALRDDESSLSKTTIRATTIAAEVSGFVV